MWRKSLPPSPKARAGNYLRDRVSRVRESFPLQEGDAMSKFDKLRQRLADIFGSEDVPAVKTETLERYLDYLKQHLEFPCQLTGIEDFP